MTEISSHRNSNMESRLRVATIFGTRPEAIKLAPVIKTLKAHSLVQVSTIVTAQHRQMLDQVMNCFRIEPDHDLSIMVQNQTLSQIVANSITKLEELLGRVKPDVVLVQGDTSTTFVASLAAFYNHIPVGHVEAGLRTRDRLQPFPEEINRRLTTVLADFHFAPTPLAKRNLLAEGIEAEKILVTGNTVIDAFQWVLQIPQPEMLVHLPQESGTNRIIFVTAHRRENFGIPMKSICQALLEIIQQHPDVVVVFPVHYNPRVREVVFSLLSNADRIRLLDPLDYADTARLIQQSTLVLTDSGGIQEEAPSLGKPVLVMREKTERPEGIEAGTARLVGTNRSVIVKEVSELLTDRKKYHAMANAINPYGDGKASERIVDFLLYTFGRLEQEPKPFLLPGRNLASQPMP